MPGYDVRAVPLPDAERDLNLEMLKFISDETARRGLHFQLGIWTHAFQWTDSPDANYTIEGLTPETQAPYCRDALRALLEACPDISGVTLRIHGESGVPEGSYDFWKTIFDGVAQCGRKVEIDMHAKGMDQPIIDAALGTGMPVNISPKFWAEHMGLPYMQGAIRQQEMPRAIAEHRLLLAQFRFALVSALRLRRFAHRGPPLRRAAPHLAGHATAAALGRSGNGRRLTGAFRVFAAATAWKFLSRSSSKAAKAPGCPADATPMRTSRCKPARDFEKYDYTYRVWGRNLYNPDGDADGWRRALAQQFGSGAEKVGTRAGLGQQDSAARHHGALSVGGQQQLLAGDVFQHADGERQPPASLQRHGQPETCSATSARSTRNFF